MYQRIVGIPALAVGSRVYSTGSTGAAGDSPTRPFIMIRSDIEDSGGVRQDVVHRQDFQVWVHDDQSSMLLIDDVISAVVNRLTTGLPYRDADWWVLDCVLDQISGDLFDDQFNTNCRHADFTIVGQSLSA